MQKFTLTPADGYPLPPKDPREYAAGLSIRPKPYVISAKLRTHSDWFSIIIIPRRVIRRMETRFVIGIITWHTGSWWGSCSQVNCIHLLLDNGRAWMACDFGCDQVCSANACCTAEPWWFCNHTWAFHQLQIWKFWDLMICWLQRTRYERLICLTVQHQPDGPVNPSGFLWINMFTQNWKQTDWFTLTSRSERICSRTIYTTRALCYLS